MNDNGKTRRFPAYSQGDETIIITKKSQWQRRLRKAGTDGTDSLEGKHAVTFVIRNMAEHVMLGDEDAVIMGRSDLESGYRPGVDLTHYGAQEHGVSRQHARLAIFNQRLYITDLGSANGTYIGGQALTPHQAHLLREGDDLVLGHLAMRVEFE